MRGLITAGVVVGLAAPALSAAGQDPSPPAAPRAARLKAFDAQPAAVSRGQAPAPPAGTLTQPRVLTGPSVTVENNPPGTAPVAPPPPGTVYGGPPTPLPGAPAASFVLPPGFSAPPVYADGGAYAVPPAYPPPGLGGPQQVAPPVGRPALAPPPHLDVPLYGGAAGPVDPAGPTGLLTGLARPGGQGRLDVSGELLLWWTKAPRVPVLVTTGPPESNGILGQPGTRTLFGGDTLSSSVSAGGRFAATYWLTPDRLWGVEGRIFFVPSFGKDFVANSSRDALLARPFINANTSAPFSQIVAAPGLAAGGVLVHPNTSLWGAEVNVARALGCDPCRPSALFGGFRYLSLSDQLNITERFVRTPESQLGIGVPTATSGVVSDQFRTENHFYGAQLGLRGERRIGSRWFAEGRASVALGTVFQTAQIDGGQVINTAAGQTYSSGGLLALEGANIGRYTQSRFGVLPEAGLKVGYYVTPNLKVGVGYNFLFLNSVLRAGDQIDPFVDVTRIPNFPLPAGAAPPLAEVRPRPTLRTTDVFVQGIGLSVQYTW